MLPDSQCCDCFEDFGTQPALYEHRKDPCRQKPPPGSYGINKEQEKKLRSRKIYQKPLDEEEKWHAIYKIIFPGEKNMPSPCRKRGLPKLKLKLMLL